MATKYECPSCGASMSLASAVSSVKCPVCRVDMTASGEVEAAKPVPPTAKPVTPSPAPSEAAAAAVASPASTGIPAGIKIAKAVSEHPKHTPPGTGPVSTANTDNAVHKLMDSARSQADKVIQDAEKQRDEILAQAEAHAREQVDAFFEKARKEAAETESQAKAEAEKILAAAKQEAEKQKLAAAGPEKADADVKADIAAEEEKLEQLKARADQASRELAEKLKAIETVRTEAARVGSADEQVAAPEADSPPALSENDIAALTRDAVDKAVQEDREKHARKDLQNRKTDVNHYARREARFIFAGSVFGALVLAYCAFVLSGAPSSALKLMTFAMIGLDGVIFFGLAGIIIGHYKAGKDITKKKKQADNTKKKVPPSASGKTKTPPSAKPQSDAKPGPVAPGPLPDEKPETEKSTKPAKPKTGNLQIKIKHGGDKSAGTRGKKTANDALRKAAMRAAAKRAAGGK